MIFPLLSLSLNLARDPLGRDISGNPINITIQATGKDKPVADKWIKFIPHNGKVYHDSIKTDNSGFASVVLIPEKEGWVEAKVKSESLKIKSNVVPKQEFTRLILAVIIGIVFILVGLDHTNKGLSRLSGEKIRQMLWKMTKNPILAYLSGIILAVLLESSLIKLSAALIILSGAALGSTFTVQIIATYIIQFSPIIVLIGFIIWQLKTRLTFLGRILLGGVGYIILKVLFVGLSLYLFFLPESFTPDSRTIANIHSLVNIWGLILIPFCFPLAKFPKKIFGAEKSKSKLGPLFPFDDTLKVFKTNNDALRKIIVSKEGSNEIKKYNDFDRINYHIYNIAKAITGEL